MKHPARARAPHWSATPAARLLGPLQECIEHEAASGIMLLAMTVIALLLANSGLAESYQALLETKISIAAGPFVIELSLLHWINDGLMAVFFFLVGLEIKREVLVGELASLRAAALPIIAAVGGVLVPAAIYLAFNFGGAGVRGWGVPMATDIAFALGAISLLGARVPFGLKIFLTAVAIVDDLIAVLVIALFYSGGLNFAALVIGLAMLGALVLANRLGIRSPLVYAGLGVLVWLAFLRSGVHATIAGVLLALTIPARQRIDAPTFAARARQLLQVLDHSAPATAMLTNAAEQQALQALKDACEQVQSPLQRLEHALQSWVAFLIMPLFALANAGVLIAPHSLRADTMPVILGVSLGLVLGKPIGLLGASWLAIRFGMADLPQGTRWAHMRGAGALAGIGFTMSLFVTTLAFTSSDMIATAKLGILLGSLVSATIGLLLLRRA